MSNELTIQKQLNKPEVMARFKLALPDTITPERFKNVALTALNTNHDIASCTPDSIMKSLVKCAQDGLLPDGREAALVKFGSAAQYMPMVYGLIKRMRNSGDVMGVNAHIVYENEYIQERFDYEIRNGIYHISHKPIIIGERGKPILVYCVVHLRNADPHVEIMRVDEVEKTRSKSKTKNTGPWVEWWDEMAKKTVIHRAAKRVPSTSDIMSVIRNDQSAMMGDDADEAETQNERRSTLISQINSAINAETGEIVDVEPTEQPQDKGVYLDA